MITNLNGLGTLFTAGRLQPGGTPVLGAREWTSQAPSSLQGASGERKCGTSCAGKCADILPG